MDKECKTNQLFMVSYAPREILNMVFDNESKLSQLKCFAFILHDKDVYLEDIVDKNTGVIVHHKGDAEIPHYHIFLRLKLSRFPSEILRWFKCEDIDGKKINTFFEYPKQCQSAIDYLTHKNNPEKYQYLTSEVVYGGDSISLDDNGNITILDNVIDNTFDIVDCLLNKMPLIQVVKIFGKDFVYHYNHYKDLLHDIYEEEQIESENRFLRNENNALMVDNDNLRETIRILNSKQASLFELEDAKNKNLDFKEI